MRVTPTILIAALVVVAGACGRNDTTRYQVGSHTFDIPKKYLMTETFPWLPVAQSSEPLVRLNPGAQLKLQITALVQPVSQVCAGVDRADHGDWVNICDQLDVDSPALNELELRQMRKTEDKYGVTWRYFSNSDRPRLIAVCTTGGSKRVTNREMGICTHIYRRDGLAITVNLVERQLPSLASVTADLNAKLTHWET